MIKAIIFDLDNCLSPTEEIGNELCEPAFDAIRKANKGKISDNILAQAFSDIWRYPLDWVAKKYSFSPEMLTAGWEVFTRMEIKSPMQGYPDLNTLVELPVLRFLVTSGFRRLQESKIKALGFKDLFTAIYIDAIDEPNRKGKSKIFQEILEDYYFQSEEVLVIGDNPDSEIKAGNQLGIKTIQILREGVSCGDNATFYIISLVELKSLL